SKADLLVWFEIQEMSSNGDYKTARVDHPSDGVPGEGTFILHQGIQRRITMTIVQDESDGMIWQGVEEVIVGRVRNSLLWEEPDNEHSTLSLSLFPAHYIKKYGSGGGVYFRCEAAWDSSLHNSPLLNRITPSGEKVYITVSVYLEMENCAYPVCITKDISLLVMSRDTRLIAARSLRSLLEHGFYRHPDCNKVAGVYELTLKKRSDSSSQRCQRKVLDTSTLYVRGEENLQGWRPRSDSLILEHQWELEKLDRLMEKERTKHFLLLMDGLKGLNRVSELQKLGREGNAWKMMTSMAINYFYIPASTTTTTTTSTTSTTATTTTSTTTKQMQQQQQHRQTTVLQLRPNMFLNGSYGNNNNNNNNINNNNNNININIITNSPTKHPQQSSSSQQQQQQQQQMTSSSSSSPPPPPPPTPQAATAAASSPLQQKPQNLMVQLNIPYLNMPRIDGNQFLPDIYEVRISHVISRKGYLLFMGGANQGWIKKWVVVRRPFVFLYKSERDKVERGLINLSVSKIEFSDETQAMIKTPNTFLVVTNQRASLVQSLDDKDFYDWLYALNPLLAGQIRLRASVKISNETDYIDCSSCGGCSSSGSRSSSNSSSSSCSCSNSCLL
ncbi:hypothetical protein HELRODRAFT_69796, partial [Helobdella robusta]|uniref:PH domain-containing protein n=1 Tax=Helobdella robusta TaxID=6412 RepID=T1FZY6_HELRO